MERVGVGKIWSFMKGRLEAEPTSNTDVRKGEGNYVSSYLKLAAKVAELQYRNRGYVLFFRGQSNDYKSTQNLTTIKPSIFRPLPGKTTLSDGALGKRFSALLQAERLLAKKWSQASKLGRQKLTRERLIRWSIIQHYEICPTPLLDVTHSLSIAASFAGDGGIGCLYVLAAPNLSGAITANAEAGLQIVRLSSICPPAAIRPHIQEGYLFGEYPEMVGLDQKQHYQPYEMDCARRLIAKFRFSPTTFWEDPNFPQVPNDALYPKGRDWIEDLAAEVTAAVKPMLP